MTLKRYDESDCFRRFGTVAVFTSTVNLSVVPNFSNGDFLVSIAGMLGNWTTDALISNPSSEPMSVGYIHWPQACRGECFPAHRDLPPYGTTSGLVAGEDYLFTQYYYSNTAGVPLPSVRLRAVNNVMPGETLDLPLVRLSSMVLADPLVLSFPGAAKSDSARSDLYLTALSFPNLAFGPSVSGVIEVRDPNGNLLASAPFSMNVGGLS